MSSQNSAKILLIERNRKLNEQLQSILNRAGYEVDSFQSGKKALAHLDSANDKPDLVLSGLAKPIGKDLSFLKTLDAKDRGLPLIILSGLDEPDHVAKAYKHGVDKYMHKKWSSPAKLLRVVEATLEEQRAVEEGAKR